MKKLSRGRVSIQAIIYQKLYRIFRPLIHSIFPETNYVKYNGVSVKKGRFLISHFFDYKRPDYELDLISSFSSEVQMGDKVNIVGGGFGVSAVKAAELTNESKVSVYEASKERVRYVKDTLEENGFEKVNLEHALVEENIGVRGNLGGPKRLKSSDISNCGVLILDCEGAEEKILKEMKEDDFLPGKIIVECHGFLGTPASKVRTILDNLGYNVVKERQRDSNFMKEKGISVLKARKS